MNLYGPLPADLVGLLLGRSSLAMQGFHVILRVIDSDFHGELSLTAYNEHECIIFQDQPTSQFLLLPYVKGQSYNIQLEILEVLVRMFPTSYI